MECCANFPPTRAQCGKECTHHVEHDGDGEHTGTHTTLYMRKHVHVPLTDNFLSALSPSRQRSTSVGVDASAVAAATLMIFQQKTNQSFNCTCTVEAPGAHSSLAHRWPPRKPLSSRREFAHLHASACVRSVFTLRCNKPLARGDCLSVHSVGRCVVVLLDKASAH